MKKKNVTVGFTTIAVVAFALLVMALLPGCTDPVVTPKPETQGVKINGKITVDVAGTDIRTVNVFLLFMDDEQQQVHPNADGSYAFTVTDAKKSANYKIKAELAGFDDALSETFALTGDLVVPDIALTKTPPAVTGMDFATPGKLTLTFNAPVEIVNTDGFTFDTTSTNPLFLAISSYEKVTDNEWNLVMNRDVEGAENVDVHYNQNAMSIKEKDADRYVKSFSNWAERSFTEALKLKVTGITAGNMVGTWVWVYFSVDADPLTLNPDGWSVSSDTGNPIAFNGSMGPIMGAWILNTSRPVVTGETLTVSYDANVGHIKSKNDFVLESFTMVAENKQ